MLDKIPQDILVHNIGKYLDNFDIYNIRITSKNILKKTEFWSDIKTYDIFKNSEKKESILCENIMRNIKNSCWYCASIFKSRNKLFKHIKKHNHYMYNFPYLIEEHKLYNYNQVMFFPSTYSMQCSKNKNCNCSKINFCELSLYEAVKFTTIYGSVVLNNITYWYSGLEKNMYFFWSGLWEERQKIKIYKLYKHYWLCLLDELYIPINNIEIIHH